MSHVKIHLAPTFGVVSIDGHEIQNDVIGLTLKANGRFDVSLTLDMIAWPAEFEGDATITINQVES